MLVLTTRVGSLGLDACVMFLLAPFLRDLFRDPWDWLTSTHFPDSEPAGEVSPVSERCDHQPSTVAKVLIAIDELGIHSTDIEVIICPVVPSNVEIWVSGHGPTGQ